MDSGPSTSDQDLKSARTFKFHEIFEDETNNGLYLNDIYIPEEILVMILSHIEPKQILRVTLVCKKWCNLVKSESFWTRKCKKKSPKKLPWYVYYCLFSTNYFNKNLIQNGNGENEFQNWEIILNKGAGFKVEDPPAGADTLPLDIEDFNGKTGCFATSYGECNKLQEISFENNNLMQFIFDNYKPHIYLSEWVAGRFDCGCVYALCCKLYGDRKGLKTPSRHRYRRHFGRTVDTEFEDCFVEQPLMVQTTATRIQQWEGSTWSKVELLIDKYPEGVKRIVFQHQGCDTQFWAGHYGSKMAGGVLKILFESLT